MLWIILRMMSIGSLAAFSASVSRALGAGQPQGGTQAADGMRQARATNEAAPKPEPFTPGLRLAPPPARPGVPLPRGSLLDLSV